MNGKIMPIKLGTDNYINRLLAFVEDKKRVRRFRELSDRSLNFSATDLMRCLRPLRRISIRHSDEGRSGPLRRVPIFWLGTFCLS